MALQAFTVFKDNGIGFVDLTFESPSLPFDAGGLNSVVRIAVGLNDDKGNLGPSQADGQAPALVAFNQKKRYIGASNWIAKDQIQSGSYVDVVVHQEDHGAEVEPAYLQVLGHDDAVCVAYIAQASPNGQQRGWLGDMGRACNKRWFLSNVEVGKYKYKPGECHRNVQWRLR